MNEIWLLSVLVSRVRTPEDESSICNSLVELLERESQSEVFVEGISYALFKMAERGLVYVSEILLRYGADLNFEGEKLKKKKKGRFKYCQFYVLFCFPCL